MDHDASGNRATDDARRGGTVQQLFDESVACHPDAPAIACGALLTTYAQLDHRAKRLARQLRRLGVGPEVVVAIRLPRSAELIVSILGVLEAGGAYLPLDPADPADRLAFLLDDSRAAVLVSDTEMPRGLASFAGAHLRIDEAAQISQPEPDADDIAPPALPGQLAYVIYTSGSTGRPKGVQVTHEGLVNLVRWHSKTHHPGPGTRLTQLASPAFDASVWEIWAALTSGACLHIPPPEILTAPRRLVGWLVAEEITQCFLPTPLAEAVLRESWPPRTALRALLTGGDRLRRRPAAELPFALVNHYGPTEATVVTTWGTVPGTAAGAGREQRPPSIGRPLPYVDVHLLDARLVPAAPGEAAELVVGGKGLARGYLGRAALTAERFVPNPFSGRSGARLYRTGDLARSLVDGRIDFLGRIDRQVKVRGFRIELGEIETVLAEHPRVRGSAVLARPDPVAGDGSLRLVAWVVGDEDSAPGVAELRDFLSRRLPVHLVPSTFVFLARLPLTSNGKIDLRALPEPVTGDRGGLSAAYVAPRTSSEIFLTGVWRDVLGRDDVGVDDDFLELGGHSLLAAKVSARVHDEWAVDLPVASLFHHPTVAELAGEVERLRRELAPGVASSAITRRPAGAEVPLASPQLRLWFLDQLAPGSPLYNEPLTFRLRGALDRDALESSLTEIRRRHEVLRTTFPGHDGRPIQRVAPPSPWPLSLHDLGSLPAAAREAAASQLLAAELRRPIDLGRGPLARALLVRLADDEHLLHLSFHHIVFDGGSIEVLIRELEALYDAFHHGEPSPLAEPTIRYGDWTLWQRRQTSADALVSELDWWERRLEGLASLELPTDRPRPTAPSHHGGTFAVELSPDLVGRVRELGRQRGATLFMTLLSTFQALLWRLTGRREVVIGTPVANRGRPELEELIGFFANTLVLFTRIDGDPSARDLLARTRDETLEAFAHQDVQFEELVTRLDPRREPGRNPLFQVVFAFQQKAVSLAPRLPGLDSEAMALVADLARFDLEVHFWEEGEALRGQVSFDRDLFDRRTVVRWIEGYRCLLEAVTEDPGRPLAEIPLTLEADSPESYDEIVRGLLEDPAVADAAVSTDGRETVAWVVSVGPWQPELLAERLRTRDPEKRLPDVWIPVSRLPFLPDGRLDSYRLRQVEVLDAETVRRWEEHLGSLPEITEVAILEGPLTSPPQRLHVGDLLPGWRRGAGRVAPSPAGGSTDETEKRLEEPGRSRPAVSHGAPVPDLDAHPATLPGLLERAARERSESGILYVDADGTETFQSYPALLAEAGELLAGLQELGLSPGAEVLFQLDDRRGFLTALWACFLGGFVPVPATVPPTWREVHAVTERLVNAWRLLDRPIVLSDSRLAPEVCRVAALLDLDGWRVETIEALRRRPAACSRESRHAGTADDLALMLLTSGSTGLPKAVMHSHRTLITREACAVQYTGFTHEEISLNWLPLDHVASLVQFHLRDVFLGCRQIQVPTEAVLEAPLRWIDWIDGYRATVTWAPNFGYALVADREAEIRRRAGWDLSCLRYALNGGEAIAARAARGFLAALLPHGLPEGSMRPVWGMSETAAGVTCSPLFRLSSTADEDPFVEVGEPINGVSFRVVDEHERVIDEGAVGRLQVRGPTVTLGYSRRPELADEVFTTDGWFRTGDLAMLRDGRLTLTGREKDVIIVHGVNHYSHEIEAVVEQVTGVEVSYTAACAVRPPGADADRVAIFFHSPRREPSELLALRAEIRELVRRQTGLSVDYLLPVAREEIPKTGVGKIQRAELRRRFESGQLDGVLRQLDLWEGNSNTLPQWFFRRTWPRRGISVKAPPTARRSLVFLDRDGLGEALRSRLGTSGSVTTGDRFTRRGRREWSMDPADPEHYRRLLLEAAEELGEIECFVHLWTWKAAAAGSAPAAFEAEQAVGALSFLRLLQAVVERAGGGDVEAPEILLVSSHAQAVEPGDRVIPARSTLPGLVRTAHQEHPGLRCRHLDLPTGSPDACVVDVLDELGMADREPEVARRRGRRRVVRLERVTSRHLGARSPWVLEEGGTYLLTGGLGGLGVELARHLLEQHRARLLLVGRGGVDSGPRAERLHALRELGEVEYRAIDLCDAQDLRHGVADSLAPWGGALDGVIHLAGVYHEAPLAEESAEAFLALLRPKTLGSWNLAALLEDHPEAFFLAFSSINSYFGGSHVGAYAAANRFLESFCRQLAQRHRGAVRCLAWSMWDEVGMSRGYPFKDLARARGFHILPAFEGRLSLEAALAADEPEMLIGLDGTHPAIRRELVDDPELRTRRLRAFATLDPARAPTLDLSTASIQDRFGHPVPCALQVLDELPHSDDGSVDHERLAVLSTTAREMRTPPQNALEQELAALWQELLGTPRVGLEDNFFALGGHSLLAAQLLSRIRDRLGVEVPVADLFNDPTLAGLSRAVEEHEPEGEAAADLDLLLAEIEGLTQEQIEQALEGVDPHEGRA